MFDIFLDIQKDYLSVLLSRLDKSNLDNPVEKRMVINCLYRILNSNKTLQLIEQFKLTKLFMDVYNKNIL